MEGFLKILENKENRIKFVAIFTLFLYLAIVVKILLIFAEGEEMPQKKKPQMMPLQTKHNILDRNGDILATNITGYNFYLSPAKTVFAEETVEKVERIFAGLSGKDEILAKLKLKRGALVLIRRDVTEDQKSLLIKEGVEGAEFERIYTRVYPYNNMFSHIVGYVNGTNEGVAGLERSLNNELYYQDVYTSLDSRIQTILHSKLEALIEEHRAISAFGVITDVKTGEVIASVSLPDFNPKKDIDPTKNYMINNVVSSAYNPGSVFKILTIALGLENGIKEGDKFDVSKPIYVDKTFTIKDEYIRKPQLNSSEILAFSSNTGSALVLEKIGFTKQRDFFERIGVFRSPKIELSPYEVAPPIFKSGAWAKSMHYTATYGYGISLSPLHFVQIAGGIVGGGQIIDLTLVKKTPESRTRGVSAISPETSAIMQHILKDTIKIGTARLANVNGYDICGKTSTTYKFDKTRKAWSKTKKMASFFAFVPCNNPKYAIYMGLDEPYQQEGGRLVQGGNVVAPAASAIIVEMAPILNVKPDTYGTNSR